MKIITGPRRSGKTTRLIRLASETGSHICCDPTQVKSVADYAKELDLDIPSPIPYHYITQLRGLNPRLPVLIDNVEIFLNRIFSDIDIRAVSFNEEENTDDL